MKKIIILFIVLFTIIALSAQEYTPELRCVHVKNNGSVSLYFDPPSGDTTHFLHYEAYWADNATGTFTLIANNMTTANTDCFDGIDPMVHRFYKIAAVYDNSTFTSNVMECIQLSLTNPGDGTSILNWNAPSNPLLDGTSDVYRVYRKNPNDIDFMLINSITLPAPLIYKDTIEVCNDLVEYKIQLTAQLSPTTNCKHSSTISGETFQNLIAPEIPTLTQVSVDYNTDQIQLTWNIARQTDVNSYVIFYQAAPGDPWTPIDTVFGRLNNTWIDSTHNANQLNFYRISARDSCGNASAMTLTAQQNMLLNTTSDGCSRKATLTWSPYVNMTNNLQKYVIYFSDNGGNLQLSGEVNATTTTYTHNNLQPNHQYCFVVKAVNTIGDVICNSIKNCFTFTVEDNSDYVFLGSVSVIENQSIELQMFTSGHIADFVKLNIYKSIDNDQNFNYLGEVTFNGDDIYTYSDFDVEVNKKIYYYRVELISECAAAPIGSNIAHSILLTGSGDAAHINTIGWLNYVDNTDSIPDPNYSIHRKMETDLSFVEIENDIAPSGYNTYTDDVAELFLYGSDFKYKVAANSQNIIFGECAPSFSNEITLKQEPTTFIPNAFKGVGSNNNVFTPINSFVTTNNYRFTIYDRWGGMIFSTEDPYTGWDGTINGKLAPCGSYVYKIQYIKNNGEWFTQGGTVTLVK